LFAFDYTACVNFCRYFASNGLLRQDEEPEGAACTASPGSLLILFFDIKKTDAVMRCCIGFLIL
jgi:hypothetical protein